MKIAFAYWEDRIAPVFDTARQIHLLEADSGNALSQTQETMHDGLPLQKASHLVELGVDTLVCGAISRPLQALIVGHGIVVIPFVAGDLNEVIQAWLGGNLVNDKFIMPGCYGRGLRRHGNCQLMEPGQGRGMGRGLSGAFGAGLGRNGGRGRGRAGSN